MKHLKNFKLYEYKLEDFEEVKDLIKDWFDASTEEIIEILPARVKIEENELVCPDCGSDDISDLDFDYETGKKVYRCLYCRTTGYEFEHQRPYLYVIRAWPNENEMNCHEVISKENGKKLLNKLSIEELDDLNSYLRKMDYSVLRFKSPASSSKSTVILSKEDLNKCLKILKENERELYYPLNVTDEDINESRLIMSPKMDEFLTSNRLLYISKRLLDLQFDEDAVEKINFLQPNGEDKVLFSKDKDFLDKDEMTFDWKNQSPKNFANVGRIVSKILRDKNIPFTDSDLETFVNNWKSYFLNPDEFNVKIVSGEDIRFWYNQNNYSPSAKYSPLGNSCMSYESCSDYFDIYVENPEVCQMIIVTDSKNKLIARALLWTYEKNRKCVDRIYYVNQGIEKRLIKWCRQNIKNVIIRGEDFKNSYSAPVEIKIQLKKWKFKHYPFVDTFSKLNWKTGKLSPPSYDDPRQEPLLSLSQQDGSFNDPYYFRWSEKMQDFIHRDDCYYDDDLESYMPKTKWQRIKNKIKNFIDF